MRSANRWWMPGAGLLWLLISRESVLAQLAKPALKQTVPVVRVYQRGFVVYRPDSATIARQAVKLGEDFVSFNEDNTDYTSQLGGWLSARRVKFYVTDGPVQLQFYPGRSQKPYVVVPVLKPAWGLVYFDGKTQPRRLELLGITQEQVDALLR